MHFPGPELSRFAAFIAALTLVLMALGALVTGNLLAAGPPAPFISVRLHTELALAVGVLTLFLAIRLAPSNTRLWIRGLGWLAVAIWAGDAAVAIAQPLGPAMQLLHATLAPVLLSALAALAFFISPERMQETETLDFTNSPSLPLLAALAPPLVLAQIALGAAYRHKLTGVMPHMGGAMLVALLLLVLSVMLLQNFTASESLRPVAVAALSIVLLQVSLGIAAFIMRLMDFDTTAGFTYLAAAHVCVGGLTLAVSCILAIELRRVRLPA